MIAPLTADQLVGFEQNGIYCGLIARVSEATGFDRGMLRWSRSNPAAFPAAAVALRKAMAEVDALPLLERVQRGIADGVALSVEEGEPNPFITDGPGVTLPVGTRHAELPSVPIRPAAKQPGNREGSTATSAPLAKHERPGSYDDTNLIRRVLIKSIKRSGLSREVIADRMTKHLGRKVTQHMLNAFTAESRSDRRWPGEFDRAFCAATGDNTLLRCRVERAGLRVIEGADLDLLELGRAFQQRTEADARIAKLQQRLAGGAR